jgi:hypothetical protein
MVERLSLEAVLSRTFMMMEPIKKLVRAREEDNKQRGRGLAAAP